MITSPDGKYHYFVAFVNVRDSRHQDSTVVATDAPVVTSADLAALEERIADGCEWVGVAITAIVPLAEPAESLPPAVTIVRKPGGGVDILVGGVTTWSGGGLKGSVAANTVAGVAHAMGAEVLWL